MQTAKTIISIIISSLCMAIAVNMCFIMYGLAPGGITGLAIVISQIIPLSTSIINLCISIPLLIIATIVFGSKFSIKTIALILLNSVFMKIVPEYLLSSSIIVCAIVGGLLVGMSIFLALNCGAATGGTDVISLLVNKLIPNVKLETIMLFVDGIIIILSGIIKKNLYVSIMSAFSLLVINATIRLMNNWREKI